MAYMYEIYKSGIKEIIIQDQNETDKFAILELSPDDDYRLATKRIIKYDGYFYISATDASQNKNRIYIK